MAELRPDIVPEVVENCKANADEAAAAFGRGLDTEVQLSVDEPGTIDMQALPPGFVGPGLAIVLTVGGAGALVLVPESSGVLPSWYADPDATGQSKLATLAQELGDLLLPERCSPDDFTASKVQHLREALTRGGVSDGAARLPLLLQRTDGTQATAHLIWPAANPSGVIAEGTTGSETGQRSKRKRGIEWKPAVQSRRPPGRPNATIDDLPQYTRSMLRIKLPVIVTLARSRQPLGRILELGPGSIIQFEKSCEEMLELDVGERSIATGEAVKVGDKFGLRINSMTLPEERFSPVEKGSEKQSH